MSNWDTVCDRFNVSRSTQRHSVRCPSHKDDRESLSLKRKPDGDVLLHCFAGCDFRDVLSALGVTFTPRSGGASVSHPQAYNPHTVARPRNVAPVAASGAAAPAADPGGDAIGTQGIVCAHPMNAGTPVRE